jgi:CRP-like cAMP-binding protein
MVDLEICKLFAGLPAGDLEQLKQSAHVLSFPAAYQIFKEGDRGDGLYLVREGQVQISAVIGQDERRILTRIGPGDFFGEMAVLDNAPRSASALTEEPSTLYFIPSPDLLEALDHSPRLAVNLLREFSSRLREFNSKYIQEVLQAERLALVGRFARSIVHDFKNPLNVIGIAAELAGMETATAAARQSAKNRIRKQVDRLSNMINELL